MKRVPQYELLDEDIGSPEEIAQSLRDLRLINRWFGGISTTAALLKQAMTRAQLREASVLEVAAGDGYSISRAVELLRRSALSVNLACLDRRESHFSPETCPQIIVGDALNMPVPDASFDFVSCALFVHHLSPKQVVSFVNEALRVARCAVLINDLRRSRLHLALVHAGLPLFRSLITRNDSVASVRQAYTAAELRSLLARTRAGSVSLRRSYLLRMGAIAWK